MLEICKYMGWDYYTYINQPYWFIELILMKTKVDAEFAEVEANKLKRKNG